MDQILKLLGVALIFLMTTTGYAAYFNPINDFKQEKKAVITLGIIWEGQDLLTHNLQALRDIKKQLRNIPIIQFLNPAYFTKRKAKSDQTSDKIKKVVSKDDIIGLHLHPWRSFTKKSGVLFRDTPTFWGNKGTDPDQNKEWGHEVPLSIYTEAEIVRMINHGKKIFSQNGIKQPEVFMAGGWMAAPHVLAAVRESGILYDASAIAIGITKNRLNHFPLYGWLKNIWGSIKPPFQPFSSQTERGELGQVVLNGGIPDYNSSKDIVNRFSEMLKSSNSKQNSWLHFQVAIYQETAWDTKRSLLTTIKRLKQYASKNDVLLNRIEHIRDLFPKENQPINIKLSSKKFNKKLINLDFSLAK